MAAPFCFEGDAVRRQGSKEPRENEQRVRLMPGLFFEFGDQAGTDAVPTGEESTPDVLVAPEIFAGFRVENGQIGIPGGRGFVVIGDRIFGDMAAIID